MTYRLRPSGDGNSEPALFTDKLVRVMATLGYYLKSGLIFLWGLLKRLPGLLYTIGVQTFFILMHCCCFLCICVLRSKPRLTEDDKGRYFRLRSKVLRAFNQNSEEDEKMLLQLFASAYPGEDPPKKLEDPRWEALGFQTSNPRVDFRGGGLMAIKQLKAYLQLHPQEAKKMKVSTKRKQFVLACNSIRTTYFLRQVFNFDDLEAIVSKERKSMKQLKKLKNLCNFLRIAQDGTASANPDESNEAVYDLMHHALLTQTFAHWQQLLERNPTLNILHLSKAEFNVKARFLKAVQARVFNSFEDFMKMFCEIEESAVREEDEAEVRRLSQ